MTLPSITNATLTKVEAPGFQADYDQDATFAATTKYSGSQPILFILQEEQISFRSRSNILASAPTRSDVVMHRTFVVSDELDVDWKIDDRVTIDSYGEVVMGTIKAVRPTRATGFDGVVRILLDDA